MNQQRQKCLHKACAAGDLDSVKRLINEGASIHRGCHTTPLYHASHAGGVWRGQLALAWRGVAAWRGGLSTP